MVNNVYQTLPETPCMFKPVGISRHQDIAKLLQIGELLKLVEEGDNISVYNLAFQKLGTVPPYLEAMLKPYIGATPDGFFYAKVKDVAGKDILGVWCTLLEAPTLPEFLTNGRIELTVWHGMVRGVSFEGRQRWWNKVEESMMVEGHYPHIALQRDPANPADSNAVKILAYFPVDEWQQVGYVNRDDARDITFAAKEGKNFYTRLISVGKNDQGFIGGKYEVVAMSDRAQGFEALA